MCSSYTFHPIYVLQLYNLALSLFIPLKLSLSRSPANNNSSLFLSGWGSIQRSVLDTIDHSLFWSTLLFQIPLHHNFLDFLLCHWLFLDLTCFAFIIKGMFIIQVVDAHCKTIQIMHRAYNEKQLSFPQPFPHQIFIFRANSSFGCFSWVWSITWCSEMLAAMTYIVYPVRIRRTWLSNLQRWILFLSL